MSIRGQRAGRCGAAVEGLQGCKTLKPVVSVSLPTSVIEHRSKSSFRKEEFTLACSSRGVESVAAGRRGGSKNMKPADLLFIHAPQGDRKEAGSGVQAVNSQSPVVDVLKQSSTS